MTNNVESTVRRFVASCPGPIFGDSYPELWATVRTSVLAATGADVPVDALREILWRAGYLAREYSKLDGKRFIMPFQEHPGAAPDHFSGARGIHVVERDRGVKS